MAATNPRLALIARQDDGPFAVLGDQTLSVAQVLGDVATVAEGLAPATHLINRCEDRYLFTVTFLAAASRGQITLLPARRGDRAIDLLRGEVANTREISDQPEARDQQLTLTPGQSGTARAPELNPDQVIARAFTSGTTGTPVAHDKPWGLLCQGRATHGAILKARQPELAHRGILATVPSWHMYGLEWSLLAATAHPQAIYSGPSFFPQDVAGGLKRLAQKGLAPTLVTTPVHLRALLKTVSEQLTAATIVSATAPLAPELAAEAVTRLGAEPVEIYGCSEIGSLASRDPAAQQGFQFFDDFSVELKADSLIVGAAGMPRPVTLADRFEREADNRFQLVGRTEDLVKVAGKRESLSRLNRELCALDGVADGVFFRPEAVGLEATGRLGALAVAPGHSVTTLRAALAERIDSAFLPRPLLLTDALPREHTSKLTQAALADAIAEVLTRDSLATTAARSG